MVKILKIFVIIISIICLFFISIIAYIRISTNKQVYNSIYDIDKKYDAALILGASVSNNEPSPMLKDRLDAGIELYKESKVDKLIMSGDGQEFYYNEVNVMIEYAIGRGIPENDIVADRNGINTSASIKNLENFPEFSTFVIVSQKFHINRALYLANKKGKEAIAYPAEDIKYKSLLYYYFRDAIAGIKDFIMENID